MLSSPPLEAGMRPLQPSLEDLACILHKCRKVRNVELVLHLHTYMLQRGLETHPSLGNHLISMLVEVGSMCLAQQVFDRLISRDECSWNPLIIGYVKCGESRRALTLYQKMQEVDSLYPSEYAFVALLKACTTLEDLERGSKLHAEIVRTGLLERDVFLGSALVDMYTKCGSLAKAQEVFDKLLVHNVVLWTALIAGYAEHGHAEEALACVEQMQHEGISPDAFTLVCSLKACGSIGVSDKGKEVHAEIVKKGFLKRNVFVGSSLVDMYTKCGSLLEAQEMFDNLEVRNVVVWTALISGYMEHGCSGEALSCSEQMEREGISLNTVTFVCCLKACSTIGAAHKGQELHADIARKGLERELPIGNILVDMYAKCGLLVTAQQVFDKLPVRDVVSWNSLIAGYVENGFSEEALYFSEQMHQEGISPSAVTFVCSLKACGSIGATVKGQEVHAEIARRGLDRDLLDNSILVDMYAKCGSLTEAQAVFDKLPVRTVVSWNVLIVEYAEHGHGEEALNCFKHMQDEGISPDAGTYVCSLKACGSIGATEKGREIHAEVARKGMERELPVGNILVDMYAKCGSLVEAQEVFDKLSVRDVVTFTALVAGYAEHSCSEEALYCFEEMQREGISLNAVAYLCSLKACGNIGTTVKGREIHAEIAKKGLERELLVGNILVDMYAKCGSLAEAQVVFDKIPVQDVVSWNTLIAGYAQLGESDNVFHVFDSLIRGGIKPDLVSFISVLNACSHVGLVDKGQMYFEAISSDYGFIPTLEHYTCMVDLLSSAGHIDKAIAMIKRMPLHPDIVVWRTVLGACRKWGNVELGRHAFEHAVQLDEKDSAVYVCMSNIYADAAMQEESNKVEAMRVEKGAWKKPVLSWWMYANLATC